MSAQAVSLSCLASRDVVLASEENNLVYFLVELTPSGPGGGVATNVCLVVDVSGSMYEEARLDHVLLAAKHVVDVLRPADTLSLIPFATEAKVVLPAATNPDKARARAAIDRIEDTDVGGGTNMAKGMRLALMELDKKLGDNRDNRVMLLTDGETSDEADCRALADAYAKKGIKCSTFGVGSTFNEALLTSISDATGGNAYYIDNPSRIPELFQKEIGAAQSVVVQNTRLRLSLPERIEVRRVWTVRPEIRDLGAQPVQGRVAEVFMGDLYQGETKSILAEVLLPPRRPNTYRVAGVEATFIVPGQGESKLTQDLTIEYTDDPNRRREVNPQVMALLDRVSVFKMQTRALQAAGAGDAALATKLLGEAAAKTRRLGDPDLTRALEDAAAEIQQQGAVSARGTKRLTYGTRRLDQ